MLIAGLFGALVALLYAPLVPGLLQDWWSHPEFSHGFLVPVVSAYLAWSRRKVLHPRVARPSRVGLALLVAGLSLALLGAVAAEPFIMRLSIPATLGGLIGFVAGGNVGKGLAFPIGYLLFMIPWPFVTFKAVALHLRYWEADAAARMLTSLGVPVLLDGYLLHFPRFTLEVADGCSGLFSIVSLMALGVLYAHLTCPRWPARAVIWLAVVPVALSVNLARILIIALVAYGGMDWIFAVTVKTATGLFNFLGSAVLLAALGSLMVRYGRAAGHPA